MSAADISINNTLEGLAFGIDKDNTNKVKEAEHIQPANKNSKKLVISLPDKSMKMLQEHAAAQGKSVNDLLQAALSGIAAKNEQESFDIGLVSKVTKTPVIATSDVLDVNGQKEDVSTPKSKFSIRVEGVPNMARDLTPFLHPKSAHVENNINLRVNPLDLNTLASPIQIGIGNGNGNLNINSDGSVSSTIAQDDSPWRVRVNDNGVLVLRTHIPAIKHGDSILESLKPMSARHGSIVLTAEDKENLAVKEGQVITGDEFEYVVKDRKLAVDDNGETVVITKEVLSAITKSAEAAAEAANGAAMAAKAAADMAKAGNKKSVFSLLSFGDLKNIGNFKSNNEAEKKEGEKSDKSFLVKTRDAITDATAKGVGFLARATIAVGLCTALLTAAHYALPDTVQSPKVVASVIAEKAGELFIKTADSAKVEVTINKEGPELKISTGDSEDGAKEDKGKEAKSDKGKVSVKLGSISADISEESIQASFLEAVNRYKPDDLKSKIALKTMISAVEHINAAHVVDHKEPLVDYSTLKDVKSLLDSNLAQSMSNHSPTH